MSDLLVIMSVGHITGSCARLYVRPSVFFKSVLEIPSKRNKSIRHGKTKIGVGISLLGQD